MTATQRPAVRAYLDEALPNATGAHRNQRCTCAAASARSPAAAAPARPCPASARPR